MRWLCAISVLAFTLGCGFGDTPAAGDKAHAADAGGSPWGVKVAPGKGSDGWDEDNPLRGLRFKGKFTHSGATVQPTFCIAGADPGTKDRMIAMFYARMNAPEDGGWLVAHAIDGTFPDTNSNTMVIDMSNPNKPSEPQMGGKGCGSATIRDGGAVTDIDRWDGSLKLDCPSIGAKGTVQFEGCAVIDTEMGLTAASTSPLGNLQGAYRSALRKRKSR